MRGDVRTWEKPAAEAKRRPPSPHFAPRALAAGRDGARGAGGRERAGGRARGVWFGVKNGAEEAEMLRGDKERAGGRAGGGGGRMRVRAGEIGRQQAGKSDS